VAIKAGDEVVDKQGNRGIVKYEAGVGWIVVLGRRDRRVFDTMRELQQEFKPTPTPLTPKERRELIRATKLSWDDVPVKGPKLKFPKEEQTMSEAKQMIEAVAGGQDPIDVVNEARERLDPKRTEDPADPSMKGVGMEDFQATGETNEYWLKKILKGRRASINKMKKSGAEWFYAKVDNSVYLDIKTLAPVITVIWAKDGSNLADKPGWLSELRKGRWKKMNLSAVEKAINMLRVNKKMRLP
jgi:hypothetical protein